MVYITYIYDTLQGQLWQSGFCWCTFAQVTVCMLLLTLLIINIVTWPVIQSNASFLPGTVQKLEATVF